MRRRVVQPPHLDLQMQEDEQGAEDVTTVLTPSTPRESALTRAKAHGHQGQVLVTLVNPDWNHVNNAPSRNALQQLCLALIQAFPATFDLSKVITYVQEKGESADKYLHRLVEAFAVYGGMPRPAETTNMTPWEEQLTSHFLRGLLPPISAATMNS